MALPSLAVAPAKCPLMEHCLRHGHPFYGHGICFCCCNLLLDGIGLLRWRRKKEGKKRKSKQNKKEYKWVQFRHTLTYKMCGPSKSVSLVDSQLWVNSVVSLFMRECMDPIPPHYKCNQFLRQSSSVAGDLLKFTFSYSEGKSQHEVLPLVTLAIGRRQSISFGKLPTYPTFSASSSHSALYLQTPHFECFL